METIITPSPVLLIDQVDPMKINVEILVKYGQYTDYLDRHLIFLEEKMSSEETKIYRDRYRCLCLRVMECSPKYYLFTDEKYPHRNQFIRTPVIESYYQKSRFESFLDKLSQNKHAVEFLKKNRGLISLEFLAKNTAAIDLIEEYGVAKILKAGGFKGLVRNPKATHLLPEVIKFNCVSLYTFQNHKGLDKIPEDIICPLIERDLYNNPEKDEYFYNHKSRFLCANPKSGKWIQKYPLMYDKLGISVSGMLNEAAERTIIKVAPELKDIIRKHRLLKGDRHTVELLIKSTQEKIKANPSLIDLGDVPNTPFCITEILKHVSEYELLSIWSLNTKYIHYDPETMFVVDEEATKRKYENNNMTFVPTV